MPALAQQDEGAPQAEPVQEIVTVTATRLPLPTDVLAGTTRIVSAEHLRLSAGPGIDEALRQIPQFSLFRRSPARASHPTAQGVNLRGIAPSGTSRALVLLDGVPLNDSFGGWIAWSRIPEVAIATVEIALGGGSAPYGSGALAGVVAARTMAPAGPGPTLRFRARGGSQETLTGGVAAGTSGPAFELLAAVEALDTGGYVAVAPEQTGAVDRPVATRHVAGFLRARHRSGWRITADAFRESRDNGTPEQVNSTRGAGGALAYDGEATSTTGWQGTLFGRAQRFDSRFSAIAEDRSSEIPVLDQRVPSWELGGAVRGWRRTGGVAVTAGLDARNVAGRSEETSLFTGATRTPGGSQLVGGLYVGAELSPARTVSVQASLRGDGWANREAPGGDARSLATASPRAGLSWAVAEPLTLRMAGYGSFRAPTLNELYRSFRVGDVTTLPNADLREESLWGADAGLRLGMPSERWSIDLSAYWNRLDDAIINATLPGTPGALLRRRENLGAARVIGVELEGRLQRGRWQLGLDAAWMSSRVTAADRADLVGNRLPQVPTHRAGASVRYLHPNGATAILRADWVGEQFEDDRNVLPLAAGVTADLVLAIPIAERWSLTATAQNLFDRRLEVGRTPAAVLGPPRSILLGVELYER